MSYRIRGHTLLCLQGFRGEGYSPAFVANMARIHAALAADPSQTVIPLVSPDVFCEHCPNLKDGCQLRGPQSEAEMMAQDREVLARLGLAPGQPVAWSEVLARIARTTSGGDLPGICGKCPWLPLGYCAAGLAALQKK